jgi:cell division inhibitor SulA
MHMNTRASTDIATTTAEHKVEQLLQETQDLWRGTRKQEASARHAGSSQSDSSDFFAGSTFADDLFTSDPAPFAADSAGEAGQSTGHAELDALLPWGAWPQSGLIEMVNKQAGIGELQLLAPLLRERSQQQSSSILWIAPPYPLHGPALAQMGVNTRNSFVVPAQTSCNQALWSIEKALQSRECGLVLAWQNWLSARVIRRLQLAAREGNTLGVLFHQRPAAHSPSTLQLQLSSAPVSEAGYRNMDVQVLKARGSHRQGRVRIKLPC